MSAPAELVELVKRVHKRLDGAATKPELDELFSLGDDEAYTRDDPRSVGRHLLITSIEFTGLKPDGASIAYSRRLDTGVNLWVGDNLVGKSSIFRVVKFALTGSNSLVDDVEEWVKEIFVEFELGERAYTVHIYKEEGDRNFSFEFYDRSRAELEELDADELAEVVDFTGNLKEYTDHIEKFFFKEFDYYKMQWTSSRGGSKEGIGLMTNNTSWRTYFKSIYLEAEDSLIFGAQFELVLQMLFGLELTYPINRLKMKKEDKQSKLGQLKNAALITPQGPELKTLQAEYQEVEAKLAKLLAARQATLAAVTTPANRELELALDAQQAAIERTSKLNTDLFNLTNEQIALDKENTSLKQRLQAYTNELVARKKRTSYLRDQQQLGAFFTSLEVHVCPSCSHEVEKTKIKSEKDTGNCRLCGDHQLPMQQEVPAGTYDEEIEQLDKGVVELNEDNHNTRIKLLDVKQTYDRKGSEIELLKQHIGSIPMAMLSARVETLRRSMNTRPVAFDLEANIEEYSVLLAKRAELLGQINLAKQPATDNSAPLQQLTNDIAWLSLAQEELGNLRNERSASLLADFEALYLHLLQNFGLASCDKVTIDDKFKLTYRLSGREVPFNKLAAGAQLRAKLGLYIALIQLDVQFHHGRHPRFIILDSPASQEADLLFVEALKEALAYIENNMKDDLQVFVGTAVRSLSTAVAPEKTEVRGEADASGKKDYFF